MTHSSVIFFLICLFLFSTAGNAARVIETTGSAYINAGAKHAAKEQAIKNAMQQALLQNKAYIDSTSTISANVLIIDSARVNASGTVENVTILDEWIDDEVYFVRIRSNIPDANSMSQEVATRYRKKIAAIQFDVLRRNEIYDTPNIEREFPREILRRLDNTGNFLTLDATHHLISTTHPGLKFDDPAAYKMIAKQSGAQIILSGQIRNLRVDESFFQDKRHFEIEIYLHDGVSGARISRHRFSETTSNVGYFKEDQTLFSNAEFYQTDFGKVVDRILASQVEFIQNDLRKIPFSAKIIKIAGQTLYFDAGSASLINTGDTLMSFRLDIDPIVNGSERYLGHVETPVAIVSVQQVQPQFSIGKLEIKNAKLSPGDLIRFGL